MAKMPLAAFPRKTMGGQNARIDSNAFGGAGFFGDDAPASAAA